MIKYSEGVMSNWKLIACKTIYTSSTSVGFATMVVCVSRVEERKKYVGQNGRENSWHVMTGN